MNKKGLAVLMRTRIRPSPPPPPAASGQEHHHQQLPPPPPSTDSPVDLQEDISASSVTLKDAKEWMRASISVPTDKMESAEATLNGFSQSYLSLSNDARRELLLALARDYDVNRNRVRELMNQYLSLDVGDPESGGVGEDGSLGAFCRMERSLRDALKPMYAVLFERLNAHTGGLKLLVVLRADILSLLGKENITPLRAVDSYLKEQLVTWLSPAGLELHKITWDDSASLLEKIVAYEAVHPIRNLLDLKRRLSVGRRCFGYLHPAIPGEPLIFIEVALLKDVAKSIQEVLWDDPPIPECEATCALFYSISATKPGLSGINLGKFLIKRVVDLLRREMSYITTFATLSPIPGYMPWLQSKLVSQLNLAKSECKDELYSSQSGSDSAFQEDILSPEEERMILESAREYTSGKCGIEVMYQLLTSSNSDWTKSDHMLAALRPPLMRLCVRYLLKEKKRGKALDPVANFHLQNGAMIERINWMADQSGQGIHQSGGIMVNYVYRLEKIEEYAQSYFSTGHIHASLILSQYVEMNPSETDA